MDDKTKLFLAVGISIIGIIVLFAISKTVKMEPISIDSVDGTFVGKTVLLNGTITKVSSSERTVFYVDNNQIPLVIFSKVEFSKDTKALITGRVDEYNEGLQILVDKIEILS